MFRRIFEVVIAIVMFTVAIVAVDSCGRSEDLLAGRETRSLIHYDNAPPITKADIQRFNRHLDKLYGKHEW